MPKHTADAGIVAGLLLILADVLEPTMRPNIIAAGLFLTGVLFIGGSLDVWLSQSGAVAQTPPTSPPTTTAEGPETVIQNSGGGTGLDLTVTGQKGATSPTIGLQTNGLKIIQSGPGTGAKVTVGGNGPAIGIRSTVGPK